MEKGLNEENFINTELVNIDSMRDESKDSGSIPMESKEDENKENSLKVRLGGLISRISKRLDQAWNSYIQISGRNLILPILFLVGTITYLEVISHILIYRSVDLTMIFLVLFALPLGILLGFVIGLFPPLVNKILLWALTTLLCIVFNIQLVYFYVFKVYFSFQSIGMAGDAASEFGSEALSAIKANIGGIILLFMPLFILAFVVNKLIDYKRRGMKDQALTLGTAGLFHVVAIVALLLFGKGDYTPYDLYYHSKVPDLCGKQLGIITMTRIDIGNILGGKNELILADTMSLKPGKDASGNKGYTNAVPTMATPAGTDQPPISSPDPTIAPTAVPIDTSPNVMNIDFQTLAESENNDTIKTLHNYFASIVPTNKNEYTGMFKGYNLIMITAEGFSPYAIDEEKTPTLYKLANEGFVFNNFYTALWQTSTSDGEYVAMTGMIPTGTRSMYHGRNNLWPFSLGNQFNLLGVASKAYHNHTYTYYQRDKTHPNLGYIYKGVGNGLNLEHSDVWPESDLEMINATVDEYVDEDQFHVYYMTVSGHMNYTFMGNSMSYKNKALVEDLPYSNDAKAYIACQIELDRALEQLIKKLEQAGVADKTVIALSADHYPYGWEKSKLDELAGHEIEPNFEIYKNHFILWCEGMEEKIVIDEPCSSMDIIPTLSNLFGLEYDSRLLMGQDILSDAPPLVFFSNRCFITDKVMYNSESGEVTMLTDQTLPEDYISNMNKIIKNKFSVSKSVLQEDYYRYLFRSGYE